MTAIPAEVAAELTRLRAENARLLRLLKLTPQQAARPGLRRRRGPASCLSALGRPSDEIQERAAQGEQGKTGER